MSGAAEKHPDKRDAILDAALALFTERGFYGTAVPAVAEAAGVGAGTIYRYFQSKEELVNALYQQHKAASIEHILRGFPFRASFREQFLLFWERWADYVARHPESFGFVELHHHASYLDEASRAIEQRVYTLVETLVRGAQAQHVIKDLPPNILIGFIQGAFIGMVRTARERGEPLTPEIVRATAQCAWEAVRV